jgi:hypothetical protein
MAQSVPHIAQTRYEKDFVAWCKDMVAKLRANQFGELDLENLIEEIESLAACDCRELENRLDGLLMHLLQRVYVNSLDNYRGWEPTIREQRRQLQLLLKQSPSLQNYFTAIFDESWRYALSEVQANYPEAQFPTEWLFSRDVEALLSQAVWQSAETELWGPALASASLTQASINASLIRTAGQLLRQHRKHSSHQSFHASIDLWDLFLGFVNRHFPGWSKSG